MIKYNGFETKPLTIELAITHSTMAKFIGERPVRPARIKELKRKVESGLFFSPRWATAIFEGQLIRMNGQHSSIALAELHRVPSGMYAIIDRFSCDTDEELAILFEQFDPTFSSRTRLEVINANGRTIKSLDDVSPTHMSRTVAGLVFAFQLTAGYPKLSSSDQARLIHTHEGFVAWANQFVGAKHLNSSGAVAAMYSTSKVDTSAATEFWTLVRDESAPNNDHPTRRLAKFLTEAINAREKQGRQWTARARYIKSIHAWNAWRSNSPTELKYYSGMKPPKPR